MPNLLLVALLAAALGAADPSADSTRAPQGGTAPGGHDTGLTGAISEEQFKALHQLRRGKVPPLHGKMIDLAGGRAYLSLPENATPPIPGLVIVHEWWGLNDDIEYWSDRLAADGYAALAVDLYGGKVATNPDSAMAYMKAVNEKRALEILLAAHDFLAKDARVRAPRRGSIGWCFGGGWSLQLALHAPDQDATVLYYGRLTTDPQALQAIHGPVLGIFGNRDPSIPPQVVNEFDAALTKAGVPHEILRYDATHAFANPSNAIYDEKAAADAWKHVRSFLAANLKNAPRR